MGTRNFAFKLNPKRLFECALTCNFLNCSRDVSAPAGGAKIATFSFKEINLRQQVECWKYSFFLLRIAEIARSSSPRALTPDLGVNTR